ncbi:replicative DNA helicase [Helicobacter saguini]|uniref:Replicative DNA helicase n=1 Tax=Helicobacter saguini TaxID=1548018 RepID=A0A347VS77_9HELI|nr:replicative DNA helicase [Helicobacter saguini]MWV62622.1 replicative DNA helicase [Helicobacter saguini]MWV66706.1 replicative DNA helicase [Helicobacter saguini]MWV71390.1 replicative DNA helicase [Helicobacter saguini]TLD94020.1 replicative DNA helicase [Helicobacter saguini]
MQNNDIILKIERVVLSAILFNPDKFDDVADFIESKDFLQPLHAKMFQAFGTLRKENKAVSPEILCMEIKKSMDVSLDDIANIAAESPIADIDTYTKEIKNASMNRALIKLASQIRDESMKDGAQAKDILEIVEKNVYALSLDDYQSDFRDAREVIAAALELIKLNKAREGALKGIDTGFSELNIATTGFNAGDLIVIGARPGMGKTALILSMALKMLASGEGIALFSLEMPGEQLMLRMMSARSQIPLQKLRLGDLDDNELQRLSQTSSELCDKANFYIDDSTNITLAGLRSKIRKLSSKDSGVKVIMIDYLQLMEGAEKSNAWARHEVIAEISRGLKNLAREVKMPIIALSQLNRTLESREDKRPILSDLRESGAIEQDADIIIFLYRDEVYKERESKQNAKKKQKEGVPKEQIEIHKAPLIEDVELILAKNRNGETKTIKIEYKKQYTLFQDKNEDKLNTLAMQNATTFNIDSFNDFQIDEQIDSSEMPSF